MPTTLRNIMDDVNDELQNSADLGTAQVSGDGQTVRFHMPDHYIDDDGSMKAYKVIAGVTTEISEHNVSTGWEMDYASSWLSWLSATPLPVGGTAYFTYKYRNWPLSQVRSKVNAGLRFIYPQFYAVRTATLTGDGTTTDFALPTTVPVAGITEVTDGATRLSPFRDYRVRRGGLEAATLRLYTPPAGTFNVEYATRPEEFATDDTTLATLGLPERVRDVLFYYACWTLLNQKLGPRVRTDTVTPLAGEGMATYRDQLQTSQYYKMLLDIEIRSKRMRSYAVRGV